MLADGRGCYRYLYSFLNWARTQGITDPAVRLPMPTYPERPNYLDADERLAQLRRCLADEALPLHLRVAGALALLFGLSITKVVRLRRDHVHLRDGVVSVQLDGHVLAIPPRLGCLLARLTEQPIPQGTAATTRLPGGSPLLYPGKTAQRPILPATLYAQFREHGIALLAGRNAARLALAADFAGSRARRRDRHRSGDRGCVGQACRSRLDALHRGQGRQLG